MSTVTSILSSDLISAAPPVLNANFNNLNNDKVETTALASYSTTSTISGTYALKTEMRSIIPFPVAGRGAVTTRQMNSNTTGYVGDIVVPMPITVTKLSIENTATGTSGSFKIGVYSEDGQTKYVDISTAAIAGAQITTTSIASTTFNTGLYYVVVVPVGTADSTFNVWQSLPDNSLDNISGEPVHSGTLTVSAGTLPTSFAPTTNITFNASHGIVIRMDN